MVGNQYYDSKSKIMLVGRAINGWENYWQHDMSVEQYAKRVLSNSIESNGLSWTRSSNNPSGYNINRSAFWRVTRGIIQGLGEDISSDWTEKLVWSNLYKIAPKDGGNPSPKLCRLQRESCKKILLNEIDQVQPKDILFITGMDWFVDFADLFSIEQVNRTFVVAKGVYGNSKIVVSNRPEGKPEKESVNEVISIIKYDC